MIAENQLFGGNLFVDHRFVAGWRARVRPTRIVGNCDTRFNPSLRDKSTRDRQYRCDDLARSELQAVSVVRRSDDVGDC